MNFEQWWDEVGSGLRPEIDADHEEHARRIARIAWEVAQQQENGNVRID